MMSCILTFLNWLCRFPDWLARPSLPPQASSQASPDNAQQTQPQNTTQEPPPAPTPPITQNTPSLLDTFLEEIKAMEGWSPGSTSYTNCNPGNLRCGLDKSKWNVLAIGANNGFCVFHGEQAGMQALRNVTVAQCKGLSPTYNAAAEKLGLTNSGYLNLYQFFRTRDPKSDKNDPDALAERFGRKLGVNPSTFLMKQLLA